MRSIAPLLTILLLAATPALAESGSGWVEVAPQGAGFRVDMPSRPEPKRAVNSTFLGQVENLRYRVVHEGTVLVVATAELPMLARFTPRAILFGEVRKSFLESAGAKGGDLQDLRRGDEKGRSLDFESVDPDAGREGYAEFFIKNGVVYTFMGEVAKGKSRKAVERFFESARVGE